MDQEVYLSSIATSIEQFVKRYNCLVTKLCELNKTQADLTKTYNALLEINKLFSGSKTQSAGQFGVDGMSPEMLVTITALTADMVARVNTYRQLQAKSREADESIKTLNSQINSLVQDNAKKENELRASNPTAYNEYVKARNAIVEKYKLPANYAAPLSTITAPTRPSAPPAPTTTGPSKTTPTTTTSAGPSKVPETGPSPVVPAVATGIVAAETAKSADLKALENIFTGTEIEVARPRQGISYRCNPAEPSLLNSAGYKIGFDKLHSAIVFISGLWIERKDINCGKTLSERFGTQCCYNYHFNIEFNKQNYTVFYESKEANHNMFSKIVQGHEDFSTLKQDKNSGNVTNIPKAPTAPSKTSPLPAAAAVTATAIAASKTTSTTSTSKTMSPDDPAVKLDMQQLRKIFDGSYLVADRSAATVNICVPVITHTNKKMSVTDLNKLAIQVLYSAAAGKQSVTKCADAANECCFDYVYAIYYGDKKRMYSVMFKVVDSDGKIKFDSVAPGSPTGPRTNEYPNYRNDFEALDEARQKMAQTPTAELTGKTSSSLLVPAAAATGIAAASTSKTTQTTSIGTPSTQTTSKSTSPSPVVPAAAAATTAILAKTPTVKSADIKALESIFGRTEIVVQRSYSGTCNPANPKFIDEYSNEMPISKLNSSGIVLIAGLWVESTINCAKPGSLSEIWGRCCYDYYFHITYQKPNNNFTVSYKARQNAGNLFIEVNEGHTDFNTIQTGSLKKGSVSMPAQAIKFETASTAPTTPSQASPLVPAAAVTATGIAAAASKTTTPTTSATTIPENIMDELKKILTGSSITFEPGMKCSPELIFSDNQTRDYFGKTYKVQEIKFRLATINCPKSMDADCCKNLYYVIKKSSSGQLYAAFFEATAGGIIFKDVLKYDDFIKNLPAIPTQREYEIEELKKIFTGTYITHEQTTISPCFPFINTKTKMMRYWEFNVKTIKFFKIYYSKSDNCGKTTAEKKCCNDYVYIIEYGTKSNMYEVGFRAAEDGIKFSNNIVSHISGRFADLQHFNMENLNNTEILDKARDEMRKKQSNLSTSQSTSTAPSTTTSSTLQSALPATSAVIGLGTSDVSGVDVTKAAKQAQAGGSINYYYKYCKYKHKYLGLKN